MSAILTLNYNYKTSKKPWFVKHFLTYHDLFKWLRQDSIILLPEDLIKDEKLRKQLLLTKLALPHIKIILIGENKKYDLFTSVLEKDLNNLIEELIINKHQIHDNRDYLVKVLKIMELD